MRRNSQESSQPASEYAEYPDDENHCYTREYATKPCEDAVSCVVDHAQFVKKYACSAPPVSIDNDCDDCDICCPPGIFCLCALVLGTPVYGIVGGILGFGIGLCRDGYSYADVCLTGLEKDNSLPPIRQVMEESNEPARIPWQFVKAMPTKRESKHVTTNYQVMSNR